ncbi:DUF7322 domain-containing protein [Haloarcula salinisoli]|uniref:DUF7322 domain-containing protein n=1 Tax=Haloarcula salinisoli TaxID=2487746 RepID=A0A8J7YBH9_9EURY|nr:hypothetical protein [Halomicroarcula salinisoli]MBX0286090.1 hypothetical protein [Halomicroarcula salinisoli]MBX0302422.1 hypothetical protein [Halomicroarcula salinisoli]
MLDGPDEDGEGVLSEKSPYEPDEFDPSSLGPDVPEAPDPPEGAANTEVTALFWKLVVVFNIALLALSVGPMLAYFEGQVDLGIRVTVVGAIMAAYGLFRYRQFVTERDSDEESDATDADGDPADHNG